MLDRARIDAENLRRFGRREAFKGGQEKGLTRARRNPHQTAGRVIIRLQTADILKPGARRRPDGMEDVIEGYARRHVGRQLAFASGERFQRDAHIIITRDLIARQRPRITADVGQMRRQPGQ
ncbi:hypothetical protein D3C81_1885180 [compost metagenome]